MLLDTDENIQKSYRDIIETISVPSVSSSPGGVSIGYAHNLGYIPSSRAWYQAWLGSPEWWNISDNQMLDGNSGTQATFLANMWLTDTHAFINITNWGASTSNCNIHIRVYLDN